MSLPNELLPLLVSGEEEQYLIERSLRFNSADSAYLSRTPASAGNRKTWTWAGWVKRSGIGSGDQMLFSTGTSGATTSAVIFFRNDALTYSTLAADILATSALFRDPSAWYHFVVSFDSTQASASARLRFFVNGSEIIQFSTDVRSAQISQNTDYGFNLNQGHEIGRFTADSSRYFNGYLAEIHFIDGQALDPTRFGEFDTNGVWHPKEYAGTYGTNGFWLKFLTGSGIDSSGNNNFWTAFNFGSSGAGNDSLVDTPTNYGEDTGAGGEVVGNYATLNPLNSYSAGLSNGNLQLAQTTTSWVQGNSTIGVSSGKWYWEVTWSSGTNILNGITKSPLSSSYVGSTSDSWGYSAGSGLYNSGSTSSYGSNLSVGDVIGVALDLDAGTLVFYNNGVSQGQAASGLSGTFFAAISVYGTTSENINFGQRPFAYAAPSGYKALCTTNLPEPTIADGSTVMDVALYTGNGSTQTISGLGFSPDFAWIKQRSDIEPHILSDAVRGSTNALQSNTTSAELANEGPTSFNSDGFSLGAGWYVNRSGYTYVAWTWDAGSSTVTNTDGSITSTVRANASAGFSIVSWTANGSISTVGHGLNSKPILCINKPRSGTYDWAVITDILNGNMQYLYLNSTQAVNNTGWGSSPTSSVMSVYSYSNGLPVISYVFSPVSGYSSFGIYTGNGSADGPFVYTGMRPKFILLKRTNSTGNWVMLDSSRIGYNPNNSQLYPNLSNSEGGGIALDILSNGFKLRINASSTADYNASGSTYIYAAFAENPFSLARAR